MTRKSATEPIQDTTLVEEAQVAHISEGAQVNVIQKIFTKEARKEELLLIIEGAQSAKNKLLLQVQESVKQLQETLKKETEKYDNLIASYSEEYNSLVKEDVDDKES